MPIWAYRMTEVSSQNRDTQSVHRLGAVRAPIVCIALVLGAGPALAGDAWDMFVARCLDPFEHQTLPVVNGLTPQPVDQMRKARRVFGPSEEGYLLVLDAAPRDGDRACAVEVPGEDVSEAADAWARLQASTRRYVRDGAWLVSNEWIEPRVKVRIAADMARTAYTVVETDLES